MDTIMYRTKQPNDDPWIRAVAKHFWGSEEIISKNHTHILTALPGIVAVAGATQVGWISFFIEGKSCEIVAIHSGMVHQGVGTALIDMVKEEANHQGCTTIWLLTTNDNTDALRFYQKRGFVITAFRRDEIEIQRTHKPIPLIGMHGIPIRDELELVMKL